MGQEASGQEQKLITLTIISAAGTLEEQFSPHMKAHAVKVRAMAHFKIDPAMADRYWLRYQQTRLQEDKTLEELAIPDKAQLYLETAPPAAG